MWRAEEDCSRPERRRLGKLGRRRLTVGYGGLTELEMKLTEDAVWTQFRLDDEVRQQGRTVLDREDIWKQARQVWT